MPGSSLEPANKKWEEDKKAGEGSQNQTEDLALTYMHVPSGTVMDREKYALKLKLKYYLFLLLKGELYIRVRTAQTAHMGESENEVHGGTSC